MGGRSLRLVQLSWAAVNTAFWTATIGLAVIAYAAGGSTASAALDATGAVVQAHLLRAAPGSGPDAPGDSTGSRITP